MRAAASGCGLSAGSAVPLKVGQGSITTHPSLEGVSVTVGSKEFTEQLILGYIAEFVLTAAGADVQDLTNIQGSAAVRAALKGGQVDLTIDYTGSAWIGYLGHDEPVADPQQQLEAVRAEDRRKNNIAWFSRAPMNNRYGFGADPELAQRLGVRSMSDLARLARTRPSKATFCLKSEFANRNDGMPGVEEAYDFTTPEGNVSILQAAAIYQAADRSQPCNFGEVYTTDGRIKALDLRLLTDDREFFPKYNATVEARGELYDAHPELKEIFDPVMHSLTNEVITDLNARADVQGADPAEVARDWLVSEGFVTAGADSAAGG